MLRVTGHQTLAVYLIVAVLLAHSAEAKDKSVQDAQKGLRNQCNHSTGRATVDLGLAAPFAVLATSAVTDAGGSQINGDMGTSPSITLPVYAPYTPGNPGLNGAVHPNDATAIDARTAAISALTDIKGRSDCATALGGVVELGGLTLKPGLYTSTSSMQSEFHSLSSTLLHLQIFFIEFHSLAPSNL